MAQNSGQMDRMDGQMDVPISVLKACIFLKNTKYSWNMFEYVQIVLYQTDTNFNRWTSKWTNDNRLRVSR